MVVEMVVQTIGCQDDGSLSYECHRVRMDDADRFSTRQLDVKLPKRPFTIKRP
jgi:hypothetical protein